MFLTPLARAIVAGTVVIYIWAYLFQSVIVASAGTAVLIYLVYRRLEFGSQLRRIELKAKRKVLEGVVHKDSAISIRLEMTSRETVTVNVKDRLPEHFTLLSGDLIKECTLAPDRPLSMFYSALPGDRGSYLFPPLDLKVTEARGLFLVELELPAPTEVLVRASRKEISLARLMTKRKQFEITGPAHRRHTRTHRADLKSIRDYMPGDRFRDIDWKAASRLTKLMTREYEEETNLPTMVLIDLSLSMRELVGRSAKIDHAVALALQISIVMDSFNHPVGMISFDETRIINHLSPGKHDLEEVLLTLYLLPNPLPTAGYPGSPDSKVAQDPEHGTSMLGAIGPFLADGRRPKYSRDATTGIFETVRALDTGEETGLLLVLISDLETNRSSMLKALRLAVSRKHRVVVVSPFSWAYHLKSEGLTVGTLERVYVDHRSKQSLLNTLLASGIRVIDIGPSERGERVISGLRRMSR